MAVNCSVAPLVIEGLAGVTAIEVRVGAVVDGPPAKKELIAVLPLSASDPVYVAVTVKRPPVDGVIWQLPEPLLSVVTVQF